MGASHLPMLLINPAIAAPRAPVPQPPRHTGPVYTERLKRCLEQATGKVAKAVQALVWRLAVHRSEDCGPLHYLELSVGYIAKAAGVGRETARQAWHTVREAVGWWPVSLSSIRARGLPVRRLAPGGVWGQHLLVPAAAVEASKGLVRALGLGPVHHALPDGPEWRVIQPTTRGSHTMCRCPWHADKNPSMLLNHNRDGVSGSGVCFSCTDESGGPLRIYWRSHEGVYKARPATGISKAQGPIQETGTIDNQGRPLVGSGRYLLGSRDSLGLTCRSSQCDDLLGVLAYAERMSNGQHATKGAAWDFAINGELPNQYVSVDRMVATEWRTLHTRRGDVRVPSRWRPTQTRWILCDLDGFTDAPIDSGCLATAGEAMSRWARSTPELSGRLAIIRTSHLGVQVVAELSEARPDPIAWHRSLEAKTLTRMLDVAALTAIRGSGFEGGHADKAVHAGGRMMRRPGWRVDKNGLLCRAKLAYSNAIR